MGGKQTIQQQLSRWTPKNSDAVAVAWPARQVHQSSYKLTLVA